MDTVLIVDDEPDVRRTLRGLIRKECSCHGNLAYPVSTLRMVEMALH